MSICQSQILPIKSISSLVMCLCMILCMFPIGSWSETTTDSTTTETVELFNWTNVSETTCSGTDQEELINMSKEERETLYASSQSFLFSTNISAAFGFMLSFESIGIGKNLPFKIIIDRTIVLRGYFASIACSVAFLWGTRLCYYI